MTTSALSARLRKIEVATVSKKRWFFFSTDGNDQAAVEQARLRCIADNGVGPNDELVFIDNFGCDEVAEPETEMSARWA